MSKVLVIYAFTAENSGEITVNEGEELDVIDLNPFDGWVSVKNSRGQQGIVPQAYVTLMENTSPKTPQSFNLSSPSFRHTTNQSDKYASSEESEVDELPSLSSQSNTLTRSGSLMPNSGGGLISKKLKNSHSIDLYLLYGVPNSIPDSEINMIDGASQWQFRSQPYQVKIVRYINDKKYHGVKKFVSYEIQAERFPQKVKRRYNHFDWLHKRLEEKFPTICIPPLPDKVVTGNFEDEFIVKRKTLLELWLNFLSAHPVICESEVFIHFLQCDDANQSKWKAGKRKAEKDEFRGVQWFCTLSVPHEIAGINSVIKDRLDRFIKSTNQLESSVKSLTSALEKFGQFQTLACKKELLNFGKKIEETGAILGNDSFDAPNNNTLSLCVVQMGNVYTKIANAYGEQSKEDVTPLVDRMNLYRGVLQQMPDSAQFEKSAIAAYEEFQLKPERLNGKSLAEVIPRKEATTHAVYAEINLFNRNKIEDFAQFMRSFLKKQISFYMNITDNLKGALDAFEQIPSTSMRDFNF